MRTILFDLDDTILDFKKSEAVAISETLRQLSLEPTPRLTARYSEINDSLWKQLERGEITRERLLVRRFTLLFAEQGISGHTGEQAQHIYEYQLSQQCYFIPGAIDLLSRLYRDYGLYLVSNGTAMVQDNRIRLAGLERYFKEIFISQRIGYNKPHLEFFRYCFQKIPDFDPEQTVIVGDSLSSDIEGGNRAGIRTCWYNPQGKSCPENYRVDWEIRTLPELSLLLEQNS